MLGGSGIGLMGLIGRFMAKQREVDVRIESLEDECGANRELARETRDTVIRLDTQMSDMKENQHEVLKTIREVARKLP